MNLTTRPAGGVLEAVEAAADYVRYTARATASGLSPEAWARHEKALQRWARTKKAAEDAGFGPAVRDAEQRLRRDVGDAVMGAIP